MFSSCRSEFEVYFPQLRHSICPHRAVGVPAGMRLSPLGVFKHTQVDRSLFRQSRGSEASPLQSAVVSAG